MYLLDVDLRNVFGVLITTTLKIDTIGIYDRPTCVVVVCWLLNSNVV